MGCSHWNSWKKFGPQKTRIMGLLGSEDNLTIGWAVSTQCQRVTDGLTDGQTYVQHIAIMCAIWLMHVKTNWHRHHHRFVCHQHRCDNVIHCCLSVGSSVIKPAAVVCVHGVLLDSELTMKQHVNQLAIGTAYINYVVFAKSAVIRRTRHRHAASLRLDSWYSKGWTTATVFWLGYLSLLWLYYSVSRMLQPGWFLNCDHVIIPAAKYYLRPGLLSSSTNNYILPRVQSRLGERAFSYAGPLAWNSLPADLQNIPDTSTFKKRLKTYLFNSAF